MQNCPSIIVLDKNSNSREVIKGYLEGMNVILFDDFKAGFEEIKKLEGNAIVILDISEKEK